MKKTYQLSSLAELPGLAEKFWADFGDQTVFLLSGGLGAGKTTFVQAVCRLLGVVDDVVSPTYTLINEYRTDSGSHIFHADLYRVENLQDALQTGIEDYLYDPAVCFIEWPRVIEAILPAKFVKLEITIDPSVPAQNAEGQAKGRIITAELHV